MTVSLTRKGFIMGIGNNAARLDLVGTALLYLDHNQAPDTTTGVFSLAGVDVSSPSAPVLGGWGTLPNDDGFGGGVTLLGAGAVIDGVTYKVPYFFRPQTDTTYDPGVNRGDAQFDLANTTIGMEVDVSSPLSPGIPTRVALDATLSNQHTSCTGTPTYTSCYQSGIFPTLNIIIGGTFVQLGPGGHAGDKDGIFMPSDNLFGTPNANCDFFDASTDPNACGINRMGPLSSFVSPTVTKSSLTLPFSSLASAGIIPNPSPNFLAVIDASFLFTSGTGNPADFSTVTILNYPALTTAATWAAPAGETVVTMLADTGDIAYVYTQSAGVGHLHIIDSSGAETGAVDLTTPATGNAQVRKFGTSQLFIGTATDIDVVDISNPTTPTVASGQIFLNNGLTGSYSGFFPFDVDAAQNLLYTVDTPASDPSGFNEVAIWDLTPVVPPTPPRTSYMACHAVGDYLFGSKDTPEIAVWHNADPTSIVGPALIGTVATTSTVIALWANQTLLYALDNQGSFYILNIDKPAVPRIISQSAQGSYQYLYAFGYIAVLSGIDGLLFLDCTVATATPTQLLQLPGPFSGAAIQAGHLFFGDLGTSAAKLYHYQWGGSYCEGVTTESLWATARVATELVQTRHLYAKGSITAHESVIAEGGGVHSAGPITLGDVKLLWGVGVPEGRIAAPPGSLFLSGDAGNGRAAMYLKASGHGNIGWQLK